MGEGHRVEGMQVYVSKNATSYGPYSLEQLRKYIKAGNFTTADMACFDGQNWVPVAQVPGLMGGPRKSRMPPPPQPVQVNVAVGDNSSKKKSCMGGCLILLVISLIGGVASSTCGGNLNSDSSDDSSESPQLTEEELRKEQLKKHFSSWDGSHQGLEKYIKSIMNDPDSYKHEKTTYIDNSDHLIITTTFRGKNAFGGVVKNQFMASVDLDGNIITIISKSP